MRLKVFLIVAAIPLCMFSQNDSDAVFAKKHKVELSLNITTTLSNSLGNSSTTTLLADPFLIGLKFRLGENIYTRLGFNAKARRVRENFGQRDIVENDYKDRLGLEKRMFMTRKILVHYG